MHAFGTSRPSRQPPPVTPPLPAAAVDWCKLSLFILVTNYHRQIVTMPSSQDPQFLCRRASPPAAPRSAFSPLNACVPGPPTHPFRPNARSTRGHSPTPPNVCHGADYSFGRGRRLHSSLRLRLCGAPTCMQYTAADACSMHDHHASAHVGTPQIVADPRCTRSSGSIPTFTRMHAAAAASSRALAPPDIREAQERRC